MKIVESKGEIKGEEGEEGVDHVALRAVGAVGPLGERRHGFSIAEAGGQSGGHDQGDQAGQDEGERDPERAARTRCAPSQRERTALPYPGRTRPAQFRCDRARREKSRRHDRDGGEPSR